MTTIYDIVFCGNILHSSRRRSHVS